MIKSQVAAMTREIEKLRNLLTALDNEPITQEETLKAIATFAAIGTVGIITCVNCKGTVGAFFGLALVLFGVIWELRVIKLYKKLFMKEEDDKLEDRRFGGLY